MSVPTPREAIHRLMDNDMRNLRDVEHANDIDLMERVVSDCAVRWTRARAMDRETLRRAESNLAAAANALSTMRGLL